MKEWPFYFNLTVDRSHPRPGPSLQHDRDGERGGEGADCGIVPTQSSLPARSLDATFRNSGNVDNVRTDRLLHAAKHQQQEEASKVKGSFTRRVFDVCSCGRRVQCWKIENFLSLQQCNRPPHMQCIKHALCQWAFKDNTKLFPFVILSIQVATNEHIW